MLPALLIVIALFAVLALARLGGARRTELLRRWPALVLGAAALFALLRGQVWFGLGLAGAAALAWGMTPAARIAAQAPRDDPADVEARALLGVGPTATAADIRAAYRAKIARAHPDRGGSTAEAARLTAARDRLLRK